jgi:hypothetical protein
LLAPGEFAESEMSEALPVYVLADSREGSVLRGAAMVTVGLDTVRVESLPRAGGLVRRATGGWGRGVGEVSATGTDNGSSSVGGRGGRAVGLAWATHVLAGCSGAVAADGLGEPIWRALRLRRGRGAMDRAAARDGEIDGARVAVAVRGDGGAGAGAFHRLGVWKVRARR